MSFLSTVLQRAVCPMLFLGLAACGGGGSGAVPPMTGSTGVGSSVAGAQPLAATTTTASVVSTTPAFSVTGQVANVYNGGFLIQAGSGCGYLKVITSSATQTALNGQTLQNGVYAQVTGTGSCATQITAATVSLAASANGPFQAPSPAPGTTSTASTSATPSFSVTGQIANVYSGGFLVQAGTGCGYLKVITSSTTQTNLNGQTLRTGVYAEVWGAGSCATQITATAVSLAATANGPFPMPSTSPTSPIAIAATPAPAIAPLTTTSSASSAGFAGIVNGQQWPVSFRPFAPNSPWNMGTAGHVADANLTSILHSQAGTYLGGAVGWGWTSAGSNDFSHPVYVAQSSDATVTTSCDAGSAYGCYSNNARVSSLTFLIPTAARPAGGSDHHISVVQPDGTTIDCWGASYSGGSFNAALCSTNNIVTGLGVESPSATSGASVAAGNVRADEVNAGVVPHALFLVAQCSSGYVYPGTSTASQCGGSLPIGAWIHLNMTAAQIAALPASDGNKAVLTALAQYGGFLLDTGGVGNAFWFANESPEQYAAYGQPYPSFPSGPSVNWAALASSFEVLQHP